MAGLHSDLFFNETLRADFGNFKLIASTYRLLSILRFKKLICVTQIKFAQSRKKRRRKYSPSPAAVTMGCQEEGFYCPDSASSLNYKGSASLNGAINLRVCVRKDHNSQLIKSNSVNIELRQHIQLINVRENSDISFSSIYKQTNRHA